MLPQPLKITCSPANGFAMFENWKPGKELENYKSTGKEVVFMKVVEPYKYTDVSNGNSLHHSLQLTPS